MGKEIFFDFFMEKNADINETDNYKQTPLFYAARDGRLSLMKKMLQNKANCNHKDLIKQTPLFYACREN